MFEKCSKKCSKTDIFWNILDPPADPGPPGTEVGIYCTSLGAPEHFDTRTKSLRALGAEIKPGQTADDGRMSENI